MDDGKGQMTGPGAPETPPEGETAARRLILRELGVKRVATWCGVAENTVHQWLSRGTPQRPIPAARVPAVLAGARAEGVDIDIAVLWPALAEARP